MMERSGCRVLGALAVLTAMAMGCAVSVPNVKSGFNKGIKTMDGVVVRGQADLERKRGAMAKLVEAGVDFAASPYRQMKQTVEEMALLVREMVVMRERCIKLRLRLQQVVGNRKKLYPDQPEYKEVEALVEELKGVGAQVEAAGERYQRLNEVLVDLVRAHKVSWQG